MKNCGLIESTETIVVKQSEKRRIDDSDGDDNNVPSKRSLQIAEPMTLYNSNISRQTAEMRRAITLHVCVGMDTEDVTFCQSYISNKSNISNISNKSDIYI